MRKFAPIAAAALLSACAFHPANTAGVQSFGQSVETMHQKQADNAPVSHAPPESGGATGALAQSRYETGHTTELLPSASTVANPSSTSH